MADLLNLVVMWAMVVTCILVIAGMLIKVTLDEIEWRASLRQRRKESSHG